jgi:hypothetical protein
MPIRRAKCPENKIKCWICGYAITTLKNVYFQCCDKEKVSHVLCWKNQPRVNKDTRKYCSNVKHYMKRDSRTADYNVRLSIEIKPKISKEERQAIKVDKIKPLLYCTVCNSDIETTQERLMKHHLKYVCTATL